MALQGHYMYTFFDPFLAEAQRSKRAFCLAKERRD